MNVNMNGNMNVNVNINDELISTSSGVSEEIPIDGNTMPFGSTLLPSSQFMGELDCFSVPNTLNDIMTADGTIQRDNTSVTKPSKEIWSVQSQNGEHAVKM